MEKRTITGEIINEKDDYLEIVVNDDNEEVVAQFKVYTEIDSVGDLYKIDTTIREDVYVDGHHWLDSKIVDTTEKTINTADICELAHAYTQLECEQLGITDIDVIDENGEVVYQDLVQPIFDKHFDFISNNL